MKKNILIAGVMLVVGASVASAQTGGINLSFDDCGTAGSAGATFACNSNSGAPFTMVASFVPPSGIDNFLGMSSQIDISFAGTPVPDWWAHGSGLCRGTTGMNTNFDFSSGPFSCVDAYFGQAAGGFAYDVGFGTPDRCRLRIQCAIPFDNRLPVGPDETYAYKVNLLRSKTTSTGSCAGCDVAACIVLNEIQLFQPAESMNDPVLTMPLDRAFVTWQSAPAGCPGSTPTRNSTWGQVKSLYR